MINLSQETKALAQRLASAKSLSPDAAIRMALEDKMRAEGIALEPRHPRDQSAKAIAERRARTDRFVASLDAMPVRDQRSPREIMDDTTLYDRCRQLRPVRRLFQRA